MQFVTVFDIATAGFRYWWAATFVVAIFAALFVAPAFVHMTPGRRAFWYVFNAMMACAFVYAGWSVYLEYTTLTAARAAGRFQIVEGPVSDFRESIERSDDDAFYIESFTVGGIAFSYTDNRVTSGFNNTAANGGPIRPGAFVRIAYKDGKILKLEMRARDIPTAAERAAYHPSVAIEAFTDQERRSADLATAIVTTLVGLRICLFPSVFINLSYAVNGLMWGIPRRRSRFRAWSVLAFALLALGSGVAALTYDLLTVDHSTDYENAVFPTFGLLVAFLIMELILRLAVWAGARYVPPANGDDSTALAATPP